MSGNTFKWIVAVFSLVFGFIALLPSVLDRGDGKLDGVINPKYVNTLSSVAIDRVSPLTLGLDLQGGLLLQYNVLVDKAVQNKLDRMASDIEKRLKSKDKTLKVGVEHPESEFYVDVTFTGDDASKADKLLNDDFMGLFTSLRRDKIGDGKFRLAMDDAYVDETKGFAVEQAIETIRQRIDALGVSEPSITRRGKSDIVVQLPGLKEKDVERAKKLIGTTALLEFRMVDDDGTNAFFMNFRGKMPKGFKLRSIDGRMSVTHPNKDALKEFLLTQLPKKTHVLGFELVPYYKDKEKKDLDKSKSYYKSYFVKKKVELTGNSITDSRVDIDQQTNTPYVSLTFDSQGAEEFYRISDAYTHKRMAIMLDDTVKSAPVFNEAIPGGRARITMGSMQSYKEIQKDSQDLVIALRHGALPAPIEKQFETVVGPSLGQDSIDSSMKALMWASILVVFFMLVYYRFSGFISVVALVFNVVLIMAILALFGATLTLPGIAGIILTIGMAVDANVIIFERIREELAKGTKAREAVALGFDKALSAVLDSNITTGIAGLVLLQFGTGPIKGFAVTLLIGIFGTLFTAVFISRLLFETWVRGDRANKTDLSI